MLLIQPSSYNIHLLAFSDSLFFLLNSLKFCLSLHFRHCLFLSYTCFSFLSEIINNHLILYSSLEGCPSQPPEPNTELHFFSRYFKIKNILQVHTQTQIHTLQAFMHLSTYVHNEEGSYIYNK